MYNITLAGVAGPEVDVAKVRIYSPGLTEVGAAPNTPFQATISTPNAGPLPVEYAFVDASGNESVRRQQTLIVPDSDAPAAPGTDLQVVSVTWVP